LNILIEGKTKIIFIVAAYSTPVTFVHMWWYRYLFTVEHVSDGKFIHNHT
jgi:hypothetical protein